MASLLPHVCIQEESPSRSLKLRVLGGGWRCRSSLTPGQGETWQVQWAAQVVRLQLWGWGLSSLAPLCPVAGHGDTEHGPNTPSHLGPSGQTGVRKL